MTVAFPRQLLAEAIGTAVLLATIVGSGIMGDALAGDQAAAALLPHSLAIGAMLFCLITLLGPISGAHFNPAVTLVFALRGEIGPIAALAFIGVQILSACAGTWLAHLMFDLDLAQLSLRERTGYGQWGAEVVATAGLITVILGGLRTAPHLIPVMVGAYIMAALWWTASTSFANPAVTVARMLTDTFAGIQPSDVLPFIAAQMVGALLGLGLARLLWPPEPDAT